MNKKDVAELIKSVDVLPLEEKVEALNFIKTELHKISPFQSEPVDCVLWAKNDTVGANDYNPNKVAPPEMELLALSIKEDGYTQPVVTWNAEDKHEVIDGFHRTRVAKENKEILKRVHGYVPIVIANSSREGKGDRIAATIRHNRARGKHQVESMSDIVVELKKRNWSDEKICKNLGMEQDEVLRLCQITGLTELFSDQEFSKSWDVEGEITEADFKELSDDISTYGEEAKEFRTQNTSDEDRIFHTYDKWECYKAGLYATTKDGMTKTQCEESASKLLGDKKKFEKALNGVITEWKNSCEHYLTNKAMNRIAWLGQASVCYALGIPATFSGGWWLLSDAQREDANLVALEYLNKWLVKNGKQQVTMVEAVAEGRQSSIY